MNKLIVFFSLILVYVACANGYIHCYHCANCPIPFRANLLNVKTVIANTGFCAKKSYSSDPTFPNSRGAAEPGLCVVAGCRWTYDSTGRQIYVCCCNTNYCNANM